MLQHLAILLSGFTLFSAILLFVAYAFFLPDLHKSRLSKLACFALLGGLASLQYGHYLSLTSTFDALQSRFYLTLLLFVPACFYYFSRFVLFPSLGLGWVSLMHLIPVVIGLFLPPEAIPPVAFVIGTSYCLWMAYLVIKLRHQHQRFAMELFFFALFVVLAVVSLVLGLLIPYIDSSFFYLTYTIAIGATMFLVTLAIVIFPDMLSDIQTVAEISYAKSKLNGVDVEAKKLQLESLMQQENVYQNEKLSLGIMAGMLEVSSHQLSELINTEYGFGFSKFVRSKRVMHAKHILLAEPKTSVLAVSIMTGFQSQSNFYSAFKEVTSMSPGQYRKSHNQ